ncbi:unnamed protein product [Parajaminaea phylloscopi]
MAEATIAASASKAGSSASANSDWVVVENGSSAAQESQQPAPAAEAVEGAQTDESQGDDDILPFDLLLHFPDRPLLPSTSTSLGLPATPSPLKLAVQPTETLNDIRLTLVDSPEGYWLGSFVFKQIGSDAPSTSLKSAPRVGEWTELREIFQGIPKGQRELHLCYGPFNESDARGHVQRLRDLLAGGHQDPTNAAIDAGLSVQDAVKNPDLWTKEAVGYAAAQAAASNKAKGSKKPAVDLAEEAAKLPFQNWTGWQSRAMSSLIPAQARPLRFFPTCLRSLAISPWSPPPQPLRARGHLLYLQVATLEGETVHLTASTNGFYVNKSTGSKFDPAPRANGEDFLSNSLFDLLCGYSPQFLANFAKVFNDPLSARDFFAVLPLTNCTAAAPWLARTHNHAADPLRPQTAYLLTGTTSLDSLEGTRDWNEEIQSARELPRSSLPERHIRERALARLFSEFSKSAANAVPKVAAGEIQALNPMDKPEAQMYCVNNLFISRGVDGVDIYPYLGGDEAAHVAVSKDVQGVRMLNTVDAQGLCLLGTVVIDWHGERWVAQSIIPGLFRKRDDEDEASPSDDKQTDAVAAQPGKTADGEQKQPSPADDTQVVYGGVEGPEVIRTDAAFEKAFEQVAKSLRLSKHPIQDAQGAKHDLWLSVDSKGLRGADGRKYALDVARLTPVDVEWLEQDLSGDILEGTGQGEAYPHEMTLLRPELMEIYWDSEFRKWARDQLAQRQKEKDSELDRKAVAASGDEAAEEAPAPEQPTETLDGSAFQLAFNPDAFVKFKPPVDETTAVTPMVTDESDPSVAAVRAASKYLRDSAIPRLLTDIAAGLASVADGQALTRQMHARGINMRYLGHLAHMAAPSQHSKLDQDTLKKTGNGTGYAIVLQLLRDVAIREMVVRASKKVLNSLLRGAKTTDVTACVSHFLNCLLGSAREASPNALWTPSPFEDASDVPAWAQLTPEQLFERVESEVRRRFRFQLPQQYFQNDLKKPQLLRELSLRSGLQLKLQDYRFEADTEGANSGNGTAPSDGDTDSAVETPAKNTASAAVSGKKKKSTGAKKLAKEVAARAAQHTTFTPDDILNLVPIIKDSAPTSKVAEDAFETGRITLMSRGDRELGVDLLLEGISFHETIYGMAHPETARCYALFAAIVHQLSTLISAETAAKVREEQEKQGKEDVQIEIPAYTEQLSGATALRYQRQAVTISERALGLDHAETMAQWASLAILERAEGNIEASLRCEARVMELQDIIYGQPHPENITAMSNLAATLQSTRNFEQSLKIFTTAHELSLKLFGAESLMTANAAFELCQAQSLVGDLRTALETLKESVRVFELTLGKEHSHTKEAELFLSRLAAAAVRAAKLEQSQKIREAQAASSGLARGNARVPGVATAAGQSMSRNNAAATGKTGRKAVGASSSGPDPALSVDELVRYISGGGAGASKSAARKGKGKASK